MPDVSLKIAVVVCSVGRPDCLRSLVPHLVDQSHPADRVLFVVTEPGDIGFDPAALFAAPTRAEVVIAPKGLPRQRNAGLDLVQNDCDLVVFFDDDYVPSRFALENIVGGFAAWPEVNGMTGHLIADGINERGLEADEASALVADYDAQPHETARVLNPGLNGLYGCNMAFRLSAVGAVRFDEALPLYGWQEDIDFAARVPGLRVKTDAFAGVHRGAKSGRETAGRRLGYSQLANPYYLWRKGTVSARFAGRLALRNVVANHAKMFRPEPWIDRRARAAGNWLALRDILLARSHPGRILDL